MDRLDDAQEFEPPADGAPAAGSTGRETGVAESTGNPDVDAALQDLGRLDALPPEDHIAVFSDIHRRLSAVLGREVDADERS